MCGGADYRVYAQAWRQNRDLVAIINFSKPLTSATFTLQVTLFTALLALEL